MSATGAQRGDVEGRHAAVRKSKGPLGRLGRVLPTWQEILLWEQTKRYAVIDALSGWRRWLVWSVGAVLFVGLALSAVLMSGLDLPRR